MTKWLQTCIGGLVDLAEAIVTEGFLAVGPTEQRRPTGCASTCKPDESTLSPGVSDCRACQMTKTTRARCNIFPENDES